MTYVAKMVYTYTKKGNYNVSVEVSDDEGAAPKVKPLWYWPARIRRI
jgi:PKD repeat protein